MVDNHCSYCLCTNNEQPVIITKDNRRYALFGCNNIYKGNTEYFNKLCKTIYNQETGDAWYTFARLSNSFTHLDKIPQTPALLSAMKDSRLKGMSFFDEVFIDGTVPIDSSCIHFKSRATGEDAKIPYIKPRELFQNYFLSWYKDTGNGESWSEDRFTKQLAKVDNIVHHPKLTVHEHKQLSYYSITPTLYDNMEIGLGCHYTDGKYTPGVTMTLRQYINKKFNPVQTNILI